MYMHPVSTKAITADKSFGRNLWVPTFLRCFHLYTEVTQIYRWILIIIYFTVFCLGKISARRPSVILNLNVNAMMTFIIFRVKLIFYTEFVDMFIICNHNKFIFLTLTVHQLSDQKIKYIIQIVIFHFTQNWP